MLAILFRPFGFVARKTLNCLAFQSVNFVHTDEDYSRNMSYTLNCISVFLLLSLLIINWIIFAERIANILIK
jgi:hypothetical protein